jgi:hypothetical protein
MASTPTHSAEIHVRNEVEIGRLSYELVGRFPGVEPDLIETALRDEFGAWSQRPVQDFVPIFVERRVRSALRDQ